MKADLQINQMLSSYSLPNDQDWHSFSLLIVDRARDRAGISRRSIKREECQVSLNEE